MSECSYLIKGQIPDCDSLKKPSGINKRIYIGEVDDIDPAIITFGTEGEITAFGLLSGATLKPFVSTRYKQAGRSSLVANEFGANTFNHFVDMVSYESAQGDVKALQDLAVADGVFAIIEQNDGRFWAYGIGYKDGLPLAFDNFGLKAETQEATTGVLLNDDNTTKTTLSGIHPNRPMAFIPANDNAANIALLDSLVEVPVFDLSFDVDGGSAVGPITNVAGGSSVTLPPIAPTKSGFDFLNWNTLANGTGTAYAPGASFLMPNANATLYAIWQAQ